MIDINKYIPSRPKQLFLISFSFFLVSSLLLVSLLAFYKPVKPVLVKATLYNVRKTAAGYNARLFTDQQLPEAKIPGTRFRFALPDKDTTSISLVFDTTSGTGSSGFSVQVSISGLKYAADSILHGQLVVFRNSESGLLSNLIH